MTVKELAALNPIIAIGPVIETDEDCDIDGCEGSDDWAAIVGKGKVGICGPHKVELEQEMGL
jgi:hypothetical protein